MAGVGGRDRERGRGYGQFSGIWGACWIDRLPPTARTKLRRHSIWKRKSHQPEARVKSMSGAILLPRSLVPSSPSSIIHPGDQKRLKGQTKFGVQKRHQKKKEGSGPVVQPSNKPVEAPKGALLFAFWRRSPPFRPLSTVKAILQG